MVRRGSTVRVRQRASLSRWTARKWAVFVACPETVDHLLVKEVVVKQTADPSCGEVFSLGASQGIPAGCDWDRQTAGDRSWGRFGVVLRGR